MTSVPGTPSCNPHSDPPVSGDCWYNCTLDDISGEDKKHRLHKVYVFFINTSCKLSSYHALSCFFVCGSWYFDHADSLMSQAKCHMRCEDMHVFPFIFLLL